MATKSRAIVYGVVLLVVGVLLVGYLPGEILSSKTLEVNATYKDFLPISGARVEVSTSSGKLIFSGTTDKDGHLTVGAVKDSTTYSIKVSKDGIGTHRGTLKTDALDGKVFRYNAMFYVFGASGPGPSGAFGCVKDGATGGVVGDATIHMKRAGGSDYHTKSFVLGGVYSLTVDDASTTQYYEYEIWAEKGGVTSNKARVALYKGTMVSPGPLVIQTTKTYTLKFVVLDAAGTPLKYAKIVLNAGTSATTNSAGEATYTVSAGRYNYSVSCNEYLIKTGSAVVSADTTVRVALTKASQPTTTGSLTGNVSYTSTTGATEGIPGALVSIVLGDKKYEAYTDDKGRYAFPSLPAGTYAVSISASMFVSKTDNAVITAGKNTNLDVTLTWANTTTPPPDTGHGGGGADTTLKNIGDWTSWIIIVCPFVVGAALIIYGIRRR